MFYLYVCVWTSWMPSAHEDHKVSDLPKLELQMIVSTRVPGTKPRYSILQVRLTTKPSLQLPAQYILNKLTNV